MKPSVYLETSIIGYLAMRRPAHLVTAANQQVTQDFWEYHRSRFDLTISEAVVVECLAGDPRAAAERSAFLDGIPILDVSEEVDRLSEALMSQMQLPEKAYFDSNHIAVAAVNGLDTC